MSDKLQVFVSYARADGEPFALSLVAALEAAGFDPFLDQHDIVGGEPWKERLTDLLKKADTIVYVVTPRAIGSTHCAWEVEEAQRLSKRLIPVVAAEVPVESMPPTLQRLNHIHFTRQLSFGQALRQLAGALRTDLGWVRKHTKFSELAAQWRAQDGQDEWLMRGEQLADAKAWLAAWTPSSPEPADLQRAYIQASAEAEDKRTSAERQQLAAMAAAQAEREKALESLAGAQAEREKALRRATQANRLSLIMSVLLLAATSIGGGLAFQLNSQQQEKNEIEESDIIQVQEAIQAAREDLEVQSKKLAEIADDSAPLPGRSDNNPGTAAPTPAEDPAAGDIPEAEPRPAPDPVDSRALERISAERWNIDVFVCAGPSAAANQQRAGAVLSALSAELARQEAGEADISPLTLGRIRQRELSEATNARKGYGLKTDEVRAEEGELDERDELFAILAKAGIATPGYRKATTSTPQYISVFMCAGG